MAKVILQNLEKHYRDGRDTVHAVKGVDLEVRDREFMVLVGPSGCGKSTILRMIAGLEDITGGTVTIGDHVVNDTPPKDRDIAMVFQNYALYPHMSVFGNMAFGLKLAGMPHGEIKQRVDEAAAILGLEDLLERKPKQLSGGQRQRVALGRAIVRKPKVFLFDEPLSNLDAKMRVQMRAEISKLHQRLDATMIYVTHDQTEAMTMGNRITVLSDGRLMQVAEPLDLYHSPTNEFVAGFIGSPPMNFLDGVVETDGCHFQCLEGGPRFALPTAIASRAVGGPVRFGIRPEAILPAEPDATETVEATIEMIEPMGSETYLHLLAGKLRLVAKVPSDRKYVLNTTEHFGYDLRRAHLFDPGSGKVLG